MLTNQHDPFRGQSRSPNMVQIDMLGMASYNSPIVIVRGYIGLQKCRDLETPLGVTQGHRNWYHSKEWLLFLSVFYRNLVPETHRF